MSKESQDCEERRIMGVMECSREGCENIMCDLYSNEYGYICSDCFKEGKNKFLEIKTLMYSEKGYDQDMLDIYDKRYNDEFKFID